MSNVQDLDEAAVKRTMAAIKVARIGFALATGDRSDAAQAAKELMYIIVDMVPVDDLKEFLSDSARVYIDLENDVAEQIKLSELEKNR